MDFFKHLPDLKAVLTIATGVLAYFGVGHVAAKKVSEAAVSLTTIKNIAREYITRALAALGAGIVPDDATIEAAVWRELAARGVKRDALRDLAIHELVVVSLGELRRRLNADASKRLAAELAARAGEAERVLDAFTPSKVTEAIGEIVETKATTP